MIKAPESIAQQYPTATLPDIYSVLAHYLHHPEDIEAYLAERESRAREIREKIERRQGDLGELRRRLLARRNG